MQTVAATAEIMAPRNTAVQAQKIADRMLQLAGPVGQPEAVRIVAKTACIEQVLTVPLQAPYGLFKALTGTENVVAVHVHESGRIEAYGPFDCDFDAYDYFPRNDTPHNTLIAVFGVPADCS